MKEHPDVNDTLLRDGEDAVRARSDNAKPYNGSRKVEAVPFVLWKDLHNNSSKIWTVRNLLGHGESSVFFGEPGSGKSALVEDLAIHIAAGWPFQGRIVRPGAVLYIALERAEVVKRRAIAFRKKHGVEADLPFALMRGLLDFREMSTAKVIIDAAKKLQDITGMEVELIGADTFNRALCGGDENSPKDVGAVIATMERIKEATNSHFLFTHHQPQDGSVRMRGHGALLAAVDCAIHVKKSGDIRSATVIKANDAEEGQEIIFQLESVTISEVDGERTTAPVVVPAEGMAVAISTNRASLPKSQTIALRALDYALAEVGEVPPASNHVPPNSRVVSIDQWRTYAYCRGISTGEERAKQKAFKSASEALIAAGRVGCWNDVVWIA